ncbi:MAG: GldG family protein, partial [Planctomycetota bacterium]
MSTGRFIFVLNAVVVTVLLVLILSFVNLSAKEWFTRVDLTEEDLFTLDDLSREIPAKFEDTVQIRYFVTEDEFPAKPEFESLPRQVMDMLNEYAAHSNGRVRVELVDPRGEKKEIDQGVKDKMEAEGVGVSSDTVFRDDKPYPKEFYSAIKMNYAEKSEVIDDIKGLANLEYQVTKALRRLQIKRIPKIGFYFSGEEKGFGRDGKFTLIPEVLRRDFLVETVDLGEKDPVPDDVDVLFVANPDRLPDRHKFAIDQYLMNGRKVEITGKR